MNKKTMLVCWLCLGAVLLMVTGIPMPSSDNSYQFYYINDLEPTEGVLSSVKRYLPESQGDIAPQAVVEALLQFGKEQDVRSPFPGQVQVVKTESNLPGVVDVHFTYEYGDLVGIERSVADYALTSTLVQLESVAGVRIFIQGEVYPSADMPPVLRAEDMLQASLVESRGG